METLRLRRICFCAALIVALQLFAGIQGRCETTTKQSVDTTLDQIDSEDFLLPKIAPASGHGTVKDGFLRAPKIRYLIDHSSVAVPEMVKRLSKPKAIKCGDTVIAYFIIFESSKDIRSLPAIADYLDHVPDADISWAGVPSHPLIYAAQAVAAITPISEVAGSDVHHWFEYRHKIAALARQTYCAKAK